MSEKEPKSVGDKVPAYKLKGIPFPECAGTCAAIEHFGAGECDSVCPEKFPKSTFEFPEEE